jgi:hypothetical protein
MFKLFLSGLLSTLIFLLSTSALAQENNMQDEEMKAWMDYMTPGPMHELMTKSSGNWKTINRYWVDPAGEPMVTEGTADIQMIFGGRYQLSNHHGMIMEVPMEGMSLMGYDNVMQEFTLIWIDNMGTGMAVAKGKFDEDTRTLTFNGLMVDPISKTEIKFRQDIKIPDDNHLVYDMYLNFNDEEFKSFEIVFIRQ